MRSRCRLSSQRRTEIIADLKPKVQKISENAVQLSYTIREKTPKQIGATVSEGQSDRGKI